MVQPNLTTFYQRYLTYTKISYMIVLPLLSFIGLSGYGILWKQVRRSSSLLFVSG